MNPSSPQIVATVLFAVAIAHTFSVKVFQHLAGKFRAGSVGENLFHLLGEVEIVFGLWAAIYLAWLALQQGSAAATGYLNSLSFTEPAFVFVIMTVAASKPVLELGRGSLEKLASLLPGRAARGDLGFFCVTLVVGPLLGSLITEPAAMTLTALLLKERFFDRGLSSRFLYLTLGALFVNVSIGGTLTHFAAPPVVMVAAKWGWTTAHMLGAFGWKAVLAIALNTALVAAISARELRQGRALTRAKSGGRIPAWTTVVHLALLALIILGSHQMAVFIGIFLIFLGVTRVTREYQSELKIQESLLVGFFLAGLIVLGGPQSWWLEPVIARLGEVPLFLSATALTAITDNAALTYLGSQVGTITDALKFSLMAGAVSGGGLTVIANAPNPAGYGILNESFGEEGISPLRLFLAALAPTIIAMLCLWFLPDFPVH